MKSIYAIFFIATLFACQQPESKQPINSLFKAPAAEPITVIAPTAIAQSPDFRFTTDAEKAKWNEAYTITRSTTIPARNVTQDATRRFVTDLQIAAWNKTIESLRTPEKLTTNAIIESPLQQFVTAADKARWNANTKIRSSFNVGLRQVDSVTIEAYLDVPFVSDFDKNKIPAPAPGKVLIIFNTDQNQLYFRTAITPWKKIWDSQ